MSLVGSWEIAGGLVALGATSLVTSASFPFTLGYLATFGRLPEERGTSLGLLFLGSTILGGVSALELLEEETQMAGGVVDTLCLPKYR